MEKGHSTHSTTSTRSDTAARPTRQTRATKELAQFMQEMRDGKPDLDQILPGSVLDSLTDNTKKCVWPIKPGTRCGNDLSVLTDEAPNTFKGLTFLSPRTHWTDVFPMLARVVTISMCRAIHAKNAVPRLEALNSTMTELAIEENSGAVNAYRDNMLDLVETWVDTILTGCNENVQKLRKKLASPNEPWHTGDRSSSFGAAASTDGSWNRRTSDFVPYQPAYRKSDSVEFVVLDTLRKTLLDTEMSANHIYIYECPVNMGYVKIGVAENVSRRLKEWQKHCDHNILEHISHEPYKAKHGYRVEKLVQAALKDVRFEKNCQKCGQKHCEWFKTTPEHAAKVIKRYSDWTATTPYKFSEVTRKLELAQPFRELMEICEPIPLPENPIPCRKPKAKTSNHSARKNNGHLINGSYFPSPLGNNPSMLFDVSF